jgi:hypothetical protein
MGHNPRQLPTKPNPRKKKAKPYSRDSLTASLEKGDVINVPCESCGAQYEGVIRRISKKKQTCFVQGECYSCSYEHQNTPYGPEEVIPALLEDGWHGSYAAIAVLVQNIIGEVVVLSTPDKTSSRSIPLEAFCNAFLGTQSEQDPNVPIFTLFDLVGENVLLEIQLSSSFGAFEVWCSIEDCGVEEEICFGAFEDIFYCWLDG